MLLKLKVNLAIILVGLLYFFTITSYANNLDIHGFIAQGVAKNSGSNFISDDEDISFDLTETGINFSYQYSSGIRFAGQGVYLNGGNRFVEGFNLDYLLVDWNFYRGENTQSHFYIGRIKNYHWLYSSTRDVPVTRPSIILPQSIYLDGSRDLSIGGDGIAFSHHYSTEKLGELDFTISSSFSPISAKDVRNLVGNAVTGNLKHDEDLQGSIYWHLANIPLTIGAAFTNSLFTYSKGDNDILIDGEIDIERFYFNVEYFSEKWTLSTELLHEKVALVDLLSPNFTVGDIGQGGFVQAEYRITEQFDILLRYERYFVNKEDKNGQQLFLNSGGSVPAHFGFQHDVTLGLSYEFKNRFKLDIEQHWVNGTARLTPIIIPNVLANQQRNWQLTLVQLSYWF